MGLPLDGNISLAETADLQNAAADPLVGANPSGYTYAVAEESLPETLTGTTALW